MARTTRYATGSGTLKAPEFNNDYVDGLDFIVATTVSAATITAGNFTLTTTATIDQSGVDGWPATNGTFCIDGHPFTYLAISGASFTGCEGELGDQAVAAITEGERGYQAVPAAEVNMIRQTVLGCMVYQASSQTGLNVTAAPGVVFDGTTELTYSGGTLALTDASTNYVYIYNNGGTATLAKNTTSWANPAVTLVPLAKVTTSGGAITAYVDMRGAKFLAIPGGSYQPLDSELTAIAGLTSAADKLPYFTGSGTAALADLTTFGRSLIDDAAASNARTTLGVVIGTDVQAYDAELAAIAGLTSAADRLPYFTGSGTAALATFTSAGRALVDDADASAQRTTLGLGTAALVSTFTKSIRLDAAQAGFDGGASAGMRATIGYQVVFTDSGGVDGADWTIRMPGDYGGGTIVGHVLGTSFNAAPGAANAYFTLAAGTFADGDAIAATLGTAVNVTSAMSSSLGVRRYESFSFGAMTPAGSPAADCLMRIRMERDSSNGGDTYAGVFEMLEVVLEYTTTGLGE